VSVDYELEGRVALVTGGSAGMGYASAKALAEQGVNVVLIARDPDKLAAARDTLTASTSAEVEIIAGDVREKWLAQKAVNLANERWGHVDILVNNAGGPPMGGFLEQDEETWDQALEQNLKSVIRFTGAVAPQMIDRGWGRVINITSTLAKEPSGPMVLSSTARAAVSAFSKSISAELAGQGVTINTLCPGGVLTDRLNSLLVTSAERQDKSYDEVLEASQSSIPIGRFADPSEFADMVLFLASERGRYVTGTTIMVDGGLTRGVF
jgi:3-oxoacyl-[acyl-carrier protein] reductase